MTHSMTATTQVDLHPVTGVVGLHALLLGRDGPRVTATWAGLERLRDELDEYLLGDEGDRPPPESEYETLGPSGWDHPSRGT